MKKIMMLVSFVLAYTIINAQIIHPAVPKNSNIPLEQSADLITNFQKNNSMTGAQNYPVSFIINVGPESAFYAYLLNNDFEFLHIYCMLDANSTSGNFSLGIAGVNVSYDNRNSHTFQRLNVDDTGKNPDGTLTGLTYIFGTYPCKNCAMNDQNMEPPATNPTTFGPYPDSFLLTVAGVGTPSTTPTAKQYISNFQQVNAGYPSSNIYPQSFLIRCDKLINDFVGNATQDPIYSPITVSRYSGLQYLQIYFGEADPSTTTGGLANQIKLIIVGLDGLGNHIYYYEDGIDYVFEEILPCPVCGVSRAPYDLKTQAIDLQDRTNVYYNIYKSTYFPYAK